MDIKTKYSIGHKFFRYNGECLQELHINKIDVHLCESGTLSVEYRLGFNEEDNYKSLRENELDAKLRDNVYFRSKADLVKYLISLIADD